MALAVCVSIGAVWLAADFAYSRYAAWRIGLWEASVSRDEAGVQFGAGPYSVGKGSFAILLVHGVNDTAQTWYRVAPALADRGYAVRALLLPGFGVPASAMRGVVKEQWTQAVATEVERLQARHKTVIAVGHSLGATVLLHYSLASPSLDGIVLLAPALALSDARSPLLPSRTWHALSSRLLVFTTEFVSPFAGNDAADPSVRNFAYKPPFVSRTVATQAIDLMRALTGTAADVMTPVLMVLTRDDRVVDWRAAHRYFRGIGAAQKTVRFYDRSRHALTVDYDWMNIVDDIDAFARRLADKDRTLTVK